MSCKSCKLNGGRSVQFYSTGDLLGHLLVHQDEGSMVPAHVLEALRHDQDDIDAGIRRWLDERGVDNRPTPQWQPADLWNPFDPVPERPEAFDRLVAMARIAIVRMEQPLSSAERSRGWSEACIGLTMEGLRSLSDDVEAVRSGDMPDLTLWDGISTVSRTIRSALGFVARCDPRFHVCEEIRSYVNRLVFGDPFHHRA